MDDQDWSEEHNREFFELWGCIGGSSRSERKLEAVKKNLIKANAVRLARRQRRAEPGSASEEDRGQTPSGQP